MFTSKASPLSMLANTEAFLSRFKWMGKDEDYENAEAAVIDVEPTLQKQSAMIREGNAKSNSVDHELSNETDESPFVSPSESLSSVPQVCKDEDNGSGSPNQENADLASFEVIPGLDVCRTSLQAKDESRPVQHNGFGDVNDSAYNVYQLATKTSSSVKSFFTSFLEDTGDGCIVPVTTAPSFQKDTIVIGDIVSTAVQGIKAGVSYFLGEAKNSREDTVHYRGFKIRTKGMELFLDAVHPKYNFQTDGDGESLANDRKIQFLFKLCKSNRFWQQKEEKKIISLPLKVYWLDQFNSTSLFIEVFESEIELEMPLGIQKDSVVVACDPDQGTISIVAPFFPHI